MNVAIAVILAMFVAGCGGPNLSVSVRAGSPGAATAVAPKALVARTGIELTCARTTIQNSFRAFKDDDHDGYEDT